MNNSHFLPQDHVWRRSRLFDGKLENMPKPRELSRIDLLQQLESVKDFNFGKHPSNKKRK